MGLPLPITWPDQPSLRQKGVSYAAWNLPS